MISKLLKDTRKKKKKSNDDKIVTKNYEEQSESQVHPRPGFELSIHPPPGTVPCCYGENYGIFIQLTTDLKMGGSEGRGTL